MNDRFRFRVWSKECSEYVEQECCDCYIRYNGELECYNLKDTDKDCIYDGYPEDDAIVEQCTRLKDKNGKLIYEGDILKTLDGSICYVVWMGISFWAESPGSEAKDWEYNSFYEHCEVIGNIHQNPELLKDEE